MQLRCRFTFDKAVAIKVCSKDGFKSGQVAWQ